MFSDIIVNLPRVVNLERLKKLYSSFSIPKLLEENGIDERQLITPVINPKTYFDSKMMQKENFTPLWLYDNTEFDSRRPDKLIKLRRGVPLPVPVVVYLPVDLNDEFCRDYKWIDANVIDYNPETKMFVVSDSIGVYSKIPRLRIHFTGEDPREYVKRVKYAVLRRDHCERILLWYMYIDKINTTNIEYVIPEKNLNQIMVKILSIKKIYSEFVFEHYYIIEDIKTNYNRCHYSAMLQSKISKFPDKFKYIKLPDFEFGRLTKKQERVNTGIRNYKDMKSKFVRKRTVLVVPDIFNALIYTNIENKKLEKKQFLITKFHYKVTLEDFLRIQLESITSVRPISSMITYI